MYLEDLKIERVVLTFSLLISGALIFTSASILFLTADIRDLKEENKRQREEITELTVKRDEAILLFELENAKRVQP